MSNINSENNIRYLNDFLDNTNDSIYHIKRKGNLKLDVSGIPEEYVPIGTIIYSNDTNFTPIVDYTKIGISVRRDTTNGTFRLCCVKKEHIELLRTHILNRSYSLPSLKEHICSMQMFREFPIIFENTIGTVYNDPFLVNNIIETYSNDRIKSLLMEKMFSNKEVVETPTTETVVLEDEEFSEYDDPEDYNEDGNEEESIPDNLPF
jgi:hypothetical protein